jgi:alkylhydroperoxidase family enzyme
MCNPSRQTVTCEVIAAPRDPFDIGEVDGQDHLALYRSQENRMPNYPIHTIASAPETSKPALEQLQQAFGVLPNIAAAIANSPKLVTALVGVFQQVHSSSLTEPEIQIVLLTDAVTNSSAYAVAFHTALALNQGVSSEETDAIRERRAPGDRRFAALSTLAKTLIEKRGHLSEPELDAFIAAGFTKEQILEVIAIVAASTITNYAGTIANPPLEDRFQQFAWRGEQRRTETPILV